MANAQLTTELQALGCLVKENEPLCAHTTFRIGGKADWLVTAYTAEQAAAVLAFCNANEIPLFVLGNGSNLLVSDNGVRGVVLHLALGEISINGTAVTAGAGVTMAKLCTAVCEAELGGLEFAFGIPGTVGGGVYMNAGAYGGEMSHVVTRVTALTPQGETVELTGEEMAFGYRYSACMKHGWIITSVTMELKKTNPQEIRAAMAEYMSRRREKQPLEYPSAGSFFKRPEGHFAGALIEQCGLKGFTVGGAQVSEKHAGFVINCGGATCADVLALGEAVKEKVQERFGVCLEREVQFVGG